MKKYSYSLRCYDNSLNLFLFKKVDHVVVCIYHCLGFKTMYNYILENNIDFDDIKITNFSFDDLFKYLIDRKSIDDNYEGERI